MAPVEYAIDKALGLALHQLDQARNEQRALVNRVVKYLEAAQCAIQGLEREYEEILVACQSIEGNPDQTQALRMRIGNYLHVDRLKQVIDDSVNGLEEYVNPLDDLANSMLRWPWKAGERADAVKEFRDHIERLNNYLTRLVQEELPERPAGTGLWANELIQLRDALGSRILQDQNPVRTLADSFLDQKRRAPEDALLSQSRKTIEKLLLAFDRGL